MLDIRRIALDARRLNGLKRGVGQYVFQLAKWLPKLEPNIEYLLFVDRPLGAGSMPAGCREVIVGRPFTTESQSVSGMWSKIRSYHWMNYLVPRALKRERADLFHATNFAVPVRAVCPCVVTIHDLIYARAPGAFEPLYERYLKMTVPAAVRRARHVITDSAATRDDLLEFVRPEPSRVSVVHLGVGDEYRVHNSPVEIERARQILRLPSRFILHVGAIERRKKLETLLAAAVPLLSAHLVDEVVLAGEEGHGADDVRHAAAELGVQDRVRYLGYVSQDLLPVLYSLAEVLSLASVYEGFGMPVLEAMACGTPVVTSNVSSLPEIAGDAALTVAPGDIDGLRQALERLLTDSGFRSEMIRRGLARARAFSWERTAAGHLAVYRQVLDEDGN
ncbi:MAG: glycosyltransferase family 1 protein [candidate division WOR-3 bacterium]|nr:glycosyltransferase family 1 protein [candidate division WOR-3 bacterium]